MRREADDDREEEGQEEYDTESVRRDKGKRRGKQQSRRLNEMKVRRQGKQKGERLRRKRILLVFGRF